METTAPIRTRVVIQARMGSTRLPGKIMADLAGRPMLAHIVRRLQAAAAYVPGDWDVVVATSTDAADDLTQCLCESLQVPCVRGSQHDVLARYLVATADLTDDDIIMRATADNPLYCPRRTSLLWHEHLRLVADHTSIENLSYAVPEAMQTGAFRRMASLVTDDYCREHVTPYFRRPPHEFRAVQFPGDWQGLRTDLRLTVDTPEDLRRMEWIYSTAASTCAHDDGLFPLEWVFDLCDQRRFVASTLA